MADGIPWLTDNDVTILRELAQERKRRPAPRGSAEPADYPGSNAYVAITPPSGFPALRQGLRWLGTSDGGTGGTGTEVLDTPGEADLDVYMILEKDPVRLVSVGFQEHVYNFSGCFIPGGEWVLVVRDRFGYWFVLEGCRAATSTTTPTTTTPVPCTGTCNWSCVSLGVGTGSPPAQLYTWFLSYDGCSPGTGTGTGQHACKCLAPVYCCGMCGVVNEETTTGCTSGIPNSPPECSGTTSSTTTSTTTTPAGGGCTDCDWICQPILGWQALRFGCSGFVNDYPLCFPCPFPTIPCLSDCDLTTTSCTIVTTTTLAPVCQNECTWVWCDTFWVQAPPFFPCVSRGLPDGCTCQCEPPSYDGGHCGDVTQTPCTMHGSCGTGTTATWTTTTPYPGNCNGDCRFVCSGGVWALLPAPCTRCGPGCSCSIKPLFTCSADGQTAVTACRTTTTSSSTTSSSTSSSTTTPTTTTPLCGTCTWTCGCSGFCSWNVSTNACTLTCTCIPPTSACNTTTIGQVAITNCLVTSSTTTPTTTTACGGYCTWRCEFNGVDNVWTLLDPSCAPTCKCVEPAPGCSAGVIISTACDPRPTTTPSTTTTCTTTTGVYPGCGVCTYEKPAGFSCDQWWSFWGSCTGGCTCPAPTCSPAALFPGCYAAIDLTVNVYCQGSATTTIATTTPSGGGA